MNNELNVLKYGYLPLTYWKNWFRNIKQFFTNIKSAYQRATRGYCSYDVWDLDFYYTRLIRDSIKYLSEHHYSFPGDKELDTDEKWTEYLEKISKLLDMSIDRSFEDTAYYINPYQDEYMKFLDTDDWMHLDREETEEEKDLREHYYAEEDRIYRFRKADREKAFKMLLDRFDDLWD